MPATTSTLVLNVVLCTHKSDSRWQDSFLKPQQLSQIGLIVVAGDAKKLAYSGKSFCVVLLYSATCSSRFSYWGFMFILNLIKLELVPSCILSTLLGMYRNFSDQNISVKSCVSSILPIREKSANNCDENACDFATMSPQFYCNFATILLFSWCVFHRSCNSKTANKSKT